MTSSVALGFHYDSAVIGGTDATVSGHEVNLLQHLICPKYTFRKHIPSIASV
jgi:hypothetical protein